VSASSDNQGVVPIPVVNYVSPGTTGTLTFSPVPNAIGSATLTVTVQDNGGTANGGLNTLTRTFLVTVNDLTAPTLEIQHVGSDALISWPLAAAGYHLEARNGFSALTSWANVTNMPALIGNRWFVTNDVSGTQRYYRLKKP
jgi:hypothetical protein